MELDPKIIQQLVETFRVELDEQLQVLTDGLLELEKKPAAKKREELLHAIFRSAHNIKGSARSINVESVANIAHHLEDLFSGLHEKNVAPTPEVIDVGLESLDCMRDAMQSFSQGTAKDFDTSKILAKLEKAATGKLSKKASSASKSKAKKKPIKQEKPKTEKPKQQRKVAAKKSEKKVKAQISSSEVITKLEEDKKDQPAKEEGSQVSKGEVSSSLESVRVAINKIENLAIVSDELQHVKLKLDDFFYVYLSQFPGELDKITTLLKQLSFTLKQHAKTKDPSGEIKKACDEILGFSDNLYNLSSKAFQTFRDDNNEFTLLSGSLRDSMQMLRLIPAATILQPLVRTARDLARQFNKKIDLQISGDNIEMDRTILALVKDPLQHLLRNAIDHGIEDPSQRIKAGKPEVGQIKIKVSSEDGKILIVMQDDGVGVDLDKIAEIAIQKKIITKEDLANKSRDDILDLIFISGLSTKKIITDISGRGVGLDVVRNNMEIVRGTVNVETETGKGTIVTLVLPLTLATEKSLLVRICSQLFIIPALSVKLIHRVKSDDVRMVESGQAVMIEEDLIPLRSLGNILKLVDYKPNIADDITVVVVSAKGKELMGFIVDEVVSEREVVVKQLEPPLDSLPYIFGATLTGRGEVLLILNPIEIIKLASQSSGHVRAQEGQVGEEKRPQLLVVDDSITTRTLLVNILSAQHFDVTSAVNGKEAWDILQNQKFDLVLTDILMPVMDGFELTEKIKTNKELQKTPVVIVTSLSKDSDREKGVEVGADAYIIKKQFESKELVDVIDQLLLT
jgi:two-component system, chemotaxis family, sensor kinase CheA